MIVLSAIAEALHQSLLMLWETFWALVLGFGLSGAVQAFVSRGEMERLLGPEGRGRLGRATFLGMVSSSCSYAASALAKSLFRKGADFTAAMVFMVASTNLVIELGIVLALLIGWQFTASEFVGGVLMIGLLALASRLLLPHRLVAAARHRLEREDPLPQPPDAADPVPPLGARLRSWAGWADAASFAIADLTMLRRELLLGFGVAGFLAALVPARAWGALFISHHGALTTLENALLGPAIAVLSFVCSIGNVPLAAALWKGGISFGGVVSFVFADLITLPLLLIYRRFYGWRLSLWILGSFWAIMSLTGLAVGALFGWAGLVPSAPPTQVVSQPFGFDYTSVLDLVFLAALAGLYYLHRQRGRLGGGHGYATDPVCGMRVEKARAPGRAGYGGVQYWFCSDRCRSRFLARPSRHSAAAGSGPGAGTGVSVGSEMGEQTPAPGVDIDPVCGMEVQPSAATPRRSAGGREFHFCGSGCAQAFERQPNAYPARAGGER